MDEIDQSYVNVSMPKQTKTAKYVNTTNSHNFLKNYKVGNILLSKKLTKNNNKPTRSVCMSDQNKPLTDTIKSRYDSYAS